MTLKQKLPALVRSDPNTASILSKLTNTENPTEINDITGMLNIPTISVETYDRIKNNDDIVTMFPDLELCIQILTSSIISPNDMTSAKLNLEAPDLKLPPDIKATIMDAIDSHITKNYDYNNKLSIILREALFTRGAYIEAIIPEASLDDIITQHDTEPPPGLTIEEYYLGNISPKGYLGKVNATELTVSQEKTGKTNTVSLLEEDIYTEITDNYHSLFSFEKKLKDIEKSVATKISSESKVKNTYITDNKLDMFFRDTKKYEERQYIEIKTDADASRESIGQPLLYKLPVEAVIPVHVISDPTRHLGYFIVVDDNGIPLANKNVEPDGSLTSELFTGMNAQNLFIQKTREALYGLTGSDTKLDNLEDIYGKIVDSLIRKKLANGLYGELADIKDSADIFRVMFYRALKAQKTKLIFIPSELVTFYAFEYRDNGTGKSLIEKNAMLYSMRAMLLYARMMAGVKNSAVSTEVEATLDENDPDPEKTKEIIMSECIKARQNDLPMGIIKHIDLVEWAHKRGIKFKFRHPSLPEMDIETNYDNLSIGQPDTELEDKLKEMIIMTYGLTPEIVESGMDSDFATTVVAKNMLAAKRIARMQEKFNNMVTLNLRKILRNDMDLRETIIHIIENNKGDITKFIKKELKSEKNSDLSRIKKNEMSEYIANVFINETNFYLSKSSVMDNTLSKEQFEAQKEIIENICDVVLEPESMPEDIYGKVSEYMEHIKGALKGSLLRRWLSDNGYMPEINELITKDDAGKPMFNAMESHDIFIKSLVDAFENYAKVKVKEKVKTDERLEKVMNTDEDEDKDDDKKEDSDDDAPEPSADDNEENDDYETQEPEFD